MASTLRAFCVSVSFAAAATAPVLAQGANDCIAAQPLKGYGTVPFSTVGATTDGLAEPLCNFFSQSNIFNDVWFRFTAPESTVVDITNCGAASFDTKIAVYGGADCASPVIACSDDSCGTQTKVTVGVTAGSQYLIRVGAYNSTATGSGSLTISPFTPLGEATDPTTGIRYVATAATTLLEPAGTGWFHQVSPALLDFVQSVGSTSELAPTSPYLAIAFLVVIQVQ